MLAREVLAWVVMSPWGSHIARHIAALSPLLVAGCTAAPPPEPAAPPAPSAGPGLYDAPRPGPPELKPEPPGAAAGLTGFHPLVAAAATGSVTLGNEQFVAFGKGVLATGTLIPIGLASPECLLGGLPRPVPLLARRLVGAVPVGWGFLGARQREQRRPLVGARSAQILLEQPLARARGRLRRPQQLGPHRRLGQRQGRDHHAGRGPLVLAPT